MKSLVALGVLAAASPAAMAEDVALSPAASVTHMSCKGGANEIKVVVRNVKKAQGLVIADLYPDRQENFLKKAGRVGRIAVAAKSPVTVFCLEAPSTALFAVAVYQDKNANQKFDKNGIGLPDEPYGVSNNPKMRFGPPKIEEAIFPVDPKGVIVEISLKK